MQLPSEHENDVATFTKIKQDTLSSITTSIVSSNILLDEENDPFAFAINSCKEGNVSRRKITCSY